jgi:hypothetical protein
MKQQLLLRRLETFGYYPLPRLHLNSPGYSGLLILLQKHPPERHEPESVQLHLHEADGKFVKLRVQNDLSHAPPRLVCPGWVIIRSRQEQEATFYTFGGMLESVALPGETVLSLRSSAPVLELLPNGDNPVNQLAEEAEALLARVAARQRLVSYCLVDRLGLAGPEQVYLAVLFSLWEMDEETAVFTHHYPKFHALLLSERRYYQEAGRWPRAPYHLEALLQDSDNKN